MAELELELEKGYSKDPVKPVTLSDGTVVKMEIIRDVDKKSMSGLAMKDEKEVAQFRVNPDSNRLFLQVMPLDGVTQDVVAEIMETFTKGVQLLYKD